MAAVLTLEAALKSDGTINLRVLKAPDDYELKRKLSLETYLQGPRWTENTCPVDCLMQVALILDLGHYQMDATPLHEEEKPIAKLLRVHGSMWFPDPTWSRPFIAPYYSEIVGGPVTAYASFNRIWAVVGLQFAQTTYTRGLLVACRKCEAGRVKYHKRVTVVETIGGMPGRHQAKHTVHEQLRWAFSRIGGGEGNCTGCIGRDGRRRPLSSIRIVTDRMPFHLVLGESFSPATINHTDVFDIRVWMNPKDDGQKKGVDFRYAFKAVVALNDERNHFTVYWVQEEDDGAKELYHYDGMNHKGKATLVDEIPSPLAFAALFLEQEIH